MKTFLIMLYLLEYDSLLTSPTGLWVPCNRRVMRTDQYVVIFRRLSIPMLGFTFCKKKHAKQNCFKAISQIYAFDIVHR